MLLACVLLTVLCIFVKSVSNSAFLNFVNTATTATDEKENVFDLTVLECQRLCICRYACTYAGWVLFVGTRTCYLTYTKNTTMEEKKFGCAEYSVLAVHMSKKTAGPCEDHTCGQGYECQPRITMGYTCVLKKDKFAEAKERKRLRRMRKTRRTKNRSTKKRKE